ncbi:MAG TPA: VTT domain-containing protein [Beijerinckiaceae bacterium]|jgi:uncharacterized membrane protein YdjX (TVP38/TMEM64 family)
MNPPDPEYTPAPRRLPRWWPLALLLAAGALALGAGLHRVLGVEAIVAQRQAVALLVEARPVLASLTYVAVYIAAVALSLPGAWWFTAMGGLLFGWKLGGMLAVLAATTGASLVFLAARNSFADVLVAKGGATLQKLAAGFKRDSFFYLLTLRLIPLFPFWLVNLAAGLVGMRLLTFAGATLAGILPGTLAFAVAGAGLDNVIEAQQAAQEACRVAGRAECPLAIGVRDLVTPEMIAAIAGLGLLSLAAIIAKRRFGPALDAGGGTP